jgi:DNA helicase II / ATP-dependent DNA helicase PcrA
VIQGIKRLVQSRSGQWSIAVLVPTKRLMLGVSDYLSSADDGLPVVNHDVTLDTEGPALAAVVIAGVLEGGHG